MLSTEPLKINLPVVVRRLLSGARSYGKQLSKTRTRHLSEFLSAPKSFASARGTLDGALA
jgi:hypothetical protein